MDLGAFLAQKWGLPEKFHGPIQAHHCPEKTLPSFPETIAMTRILFLASLVVDFFNAQLIYTIENAMAVVGRLRKSIESFPFEYEGRRIPLTMSFGVAFQPPGSQVDKDDLVKMAASLKTQTRSFH